MFKHLPKEAMQELAARLSRMSIRDVDFEPERHPKDEDIVVIVQKGVNKKIRLGDLRSALIGGLDYSDLSVGMLEEIADYVIEKIESEKLDEWCKKCGGSSDTTTTKTYTFVITSVTPSGAAVKVNGSAYTVGTSLTVNEGDTVKVTATASGYDDYSASYTVSKDTSVTIAMTKTAVTPTTYTFKITSVTPSSASVKVNGSSYTTGTSLPVASGDSVVVTATADGYEDYSKTYTIGATNMSVSVVMTAKTVDPTKYSFVITSVNPSEAAVKVNGKAYTVGDELSFESGAEVTVTASAKGYDIYSEKYTISDNTEVSVTMSKITWWKWSNLDSGNGDSSLSYEVYINSRVKGDANSGSGYGIDDDLIIKSSLSGVEIAYSYADSSTGKFPTGSLVYSVTLPKNTTGIAREITISLYAADGTTVLASYVINQKSTAEQSQTGSIAVSATELSFDYTGGERSLTVQSNKDFTIDIDDNNN